MRTVSLPAGISGTVAMRLVEDGAHVEAGDRVIEVESMKTFWSVAAPCAGIVRHQAELGEVVGQDQIIAIIEKD